MTFRPAALIFGIAALIFCPLSSVALKAQVTGATLSGVITDTASAVVPNAKVTVTNAASGQSAQTLSDSNGRYIVPALMPGDYELAISAPGYSTNTMKVTISPGSNSTMDVRLGGVLSLGDLGFSPSQSQGSAQAQARLDKRSHMLKIHQRLGLIDAAPLLATVILGAGAGGKSTSSADRWAHLALGSLTGDLYFTSAYYAIRAPSIPGTRRRGQIRVHKALAWIHGPGMILTPILGAMAFDQKSKGEKVHGIAGAHGAVAGITAAAYGAAILSVSFKF